MANKSSKPSPQLKESVKTPTNITSKETIKYNWKRAVEAKIIKSLVSQKKFLKYKNNRDGFFKDSKYKIIKKWPPGNKNALNIHSRRGIKLFVNDSGVLLLFFNKNTCVFICAGACEDFNRE